MTDSKETKKIILASASPRRREILLSMGVDFTVIAADADESCDITDPKTLTEELARRKGEAVYKLLQKRGDERNTVIISADTVVVCQGKILGKPQSRVEAFEMLELLSGKEHIVATGVALISDGTVATDCSLTKVFVDSIPQTELEKYIDSGEPFDKAGGYGIQGSFSRWISGIEGCYFGVVGLPTNTLSKLFYKQLGYYPNEL